jgi:proteasome assembly chaperone (PAC2) family protein
MKAVMVEDADIRKPIVIAAMQDMGNVGSIAIDFINKSLGTRPFRQISIPFPNYVVDSGGYIDFQRERWEYRYGSDGSVVVFGGGMGQPQTNQELYDLCEDVVGIARQYSAQLVYTLGAFHTDRKYGKNPKTFFAATTQELAGQIQRLGLEPTPGSSLITGFNGLILELAKESGLQGIGLYAEIDDPQIPQFRAAKSLLVTLEKLTYQKFRGMEELDEMASRVESEGGKEF